MSLFLSTGKCFTTKNDNCAYKARRNETEADFSAQHQRLKFRSSLLRIFLLSHFLPERTCRCHKKALKYISLFAILLAEHEVPFSIIWTNAKTVVIKFVLALRRAKLFCS